MQLEFYKYQGTGNDFIILDNRLSIFNKSNTKLIHDLCNRRFGIGADGLILLEKDVTTDFKMLYFNADGNESSMCGNGGRCIVAFAKFLKIINSETSFQAIDGVHHAVINNKNRVRLQMQDVAIIEKHAAYTFLNTGSPHHVVLVDNLDAINVKQQGAAIRYSKLYGKSGTNVNFVQPINNSTFAVRTYERGVENETYSCGTGVTAVALAMYATGVTHKKNIALQTPGGNLNVYFTPQEDGFTNIWLEGPTQQVFKGTVLCKH